MIGEVKTARIVFNYEVLTGLNLVTESISSSIDGLLKITNDKRRLHANQSENTEMSSVEEHAVLCAVSSLATKLGHKSYQCLQCRKALPSSGDWYVTNLWHSNPIICWRIATLPVPACVGKGSPTGIVKASISNLLRGLQLLFTHRLALLSQCPRQHISGGPDGSTFQTPLPFAFPLTSQYLITIPGRRGLTAS